MSKEYSRSVCALPFVEKNKLEQTLDQLRELPLDKDVDVKDYERMRKFQEDFCDYIQDTWIRLVSLIIKTNANPNLYFYYLTRQLLSRLQKALRILCKIMQLVSK